MGSLEYLNQVEQEAEALQELYNLAETDGGKLLIKNQKLKVKAMMIAYAPFHLTLI